MNDDERRLHDWFDEELDRMAISGDRPVDPQRVFASETDRALSETAADLRRLDAAQASEPSAGFLNNLEKQLMSTSTAGHSWSGPVPESRRETLGAPGQPFRPQRRPTFGLTLSNIATFALVFALMAASAGAYFLMRDSGSPAPESPRYAALGGTPVATPGPDSSAWFDDEPIANWSISFPDGTTSAETGHTRIGNGHVYRQLRYSSNSEDGYFNGIQAIDAATGEITWEHRGNWLRTFFAIDDANVYSTAAANRIEAYEAFTGELIWGADLGGSVVSAALYEGTIYAWLTSHALVAVQADDGTILWSSAVESAAEFQLGGQGNAIVTFELIATETGIASVTADGSLVAFDRHTGNVRWQLGGYDPGRTQLASTDGVLLAVTHEEPDTLWESFPTSHGVGIDLVTGDVLYAFTAEGPISYIVTPGGTGMFHMIADEIVTTDSPVASGTPEVDFDYRGSNAHWVLPDGPGPYGGEPPEGADFVFGIDARTGQVVWQRSAIGRDFAAIYSSYASSERIWALTYDNQIVLLNGERGLILDPPVTLENAVKRLVPGTVEEGIAIELLGGTLIGYGAVDSDQQG